LIAGVDASYQKALIIGGIVILTYPKLTMLDYDYAVSSALKELRRRVIFELALVTVVPLTAVVVLGLFLLEYFSRKRKSSQERKAMKEDGGNDEN
ncbi:MAG: Uncharacterized protein XD94_0700, partial [Mesotoga prima]